MEKKKIVTGIILVVAMLFMVMPAWAAGGQNTLRGADITIGVWWDDLDPFVRQPTNDYEERYFAHLRNMLTSHNFRMRESNVGTWETIMQRAVLSTMAGNPEANVYIVEGGWAKVMQTRGLLFPISDSHAVDMTPNPVGSGKVEWSAPVRDAFRASDGKSYAFGVGHGRMTYPMLVFFNKRLFREAGLDPNLPYEMQRAGTWTWDNFIDLCRRLTRDTNNDGTIDIYALTRDSNLEMHNAFISSNGANYVNLVNGRFVNTSNTPAFIEALNFMRRLDNEGVLKLRPENAQWDWYIPEFIEGRVAMHIEPEWRSQHFRNMRDEWGAVVIPRGPRVSEYVIFQDELVYVIPNTFTLPQVDQVLQAVELWRTPFDNSPNAWKDQYMALYRCPRAIDETLAILREPKQTLQKYHLWVPGLNVGDIVWNNWGSDLTAAQLVESVTPAWNAIIAEANDM
jgi:ABC-type glycerol-3-phosphate transport system substrate-binding protein